MQQKTCEGNKSSWQDSARNGNVYKPFRCPQCGENIRFRTLSSLRAHLDYMHSYEERYFLGKSSIICSLKESEPKSSLEPLNEIQIGSSNNGLKQKTSISAFCDLTNENKKISSPIETLSEQTLIKSLFSDDSANIHNPVSGYPSTRTKLHLEPQAKVMFNQIADAVDKTIEKKIDKLNKELCQKTSELLEVRAAFLQLSQKKQEVQRRERALSRQVDVAVELIAILRQRLTESEQELQRKEEEVVTINHFLEAAAEKEFRGKRRLQQFIENLLQRVELAEKQLEYYQNRQIKNTQACVGDAMGGQIIANRKSKCQNRCSYHPGNITHDARPQSVQKGRTYVNRVGIQPMKLLHEATDNSKDLWKVQKIGDPTVVGRKVLHKTKLGKKPGMCNNVYKQY
ncbi:ZNF365 isoform X1 [Pelobates cultripes]|uniref:ZNF365 isoform X1 n=1 Tax=Pelobates cultripes TaxID=61616 RepID=A0AAD1TFS0_PELCU|nr:ZNF365 isoform X1 [Pelobates cultripes]